jgi:hypothetical protein
VGLKLNATLQLLVYADDVYLLGDNIDTIKKPHKLLTDACKKVYWWESQKKRDHWEGQGIGGWSILKWILERLDGMVWIGLIWLRIGTG